MIRPQSFSGAMPLDREFHPCFSGPTPLGTGWLRMLELCVFLPCPLERWQEKKLRCPKLNYIRPEGGWRKRPEVNQLITAGQNQQKTAYIPERMLEIQIDFQAAVFCNFLKRTARCHKPLGTSAPSVGMNSPGCCPPPSHGASTPSFWTPHLPQNQARFTFSHPLHQ